MASVPKGMASRPNRMSSGLKTMKLGPFLMGFAPYLITIGLKGMDPEAGSMRPTTKLFRPIVKGRSLETEGIPYSFVTVKLAVPEAPSAIMWYCPAGSVSVPCSGMRCLPAANKPRCRSSITSRPVASTKRKVSCCGESRMNSSNGVSRNGLGTTW